MASLRIGILGAGAIGGYLGVRLSAAGADVTLVGRSTPVDAATLRAIDDRGAVHLPKRLRVTDDPRALAGVDLCFVTTKSDDTAAAGETLAGILPGDVVVVSFQNGLANVPALRQALPNPIAAGMVTFNVVREGGEGEGAGEGEGEGAGTTFRKTTDGPLLAERMRGSGEERGGGDGGDERDDDDAKAHGRAGQRMEALASLFAAAGEPLGLRDDMEAVQAGKLLLNLNNGLCALTGTSIAESIQSPELRSSFAACLREGIDVMTRAGVPHTSIGRLSPRLLSRVLRLPDLLVRPLARRFMSIDPAARSSTLQDLQRGRRTEIEHLNGAIVALATRAGSDAPVNGFVTRQVHALEAIAVAGTRPLPFLTPRQTWAGIQAALRSPGRRDADRYPGRRSSPDPGRFDPRE